MAGNHMDAVRRFELMTGQKAKKGEEATASSPRAAAEEKPTKNHLISGTGTAPGRDALRRFELMTGSRTAQRAKQDTQKTPTMKELADQAEQEYRNYVGSSANLQARQAAVQQYNAAHKWDGLKNALMNPLGGGGFGLPTQTSSIDATDPKERELKAKVEYYKAQAQMEADQAVMDADLAEIESWDESDRAALEWYAAEDMGNWYDNLTRASTDTIMQVPKADSRIQYLIDKYGRKRVKELASSYVRSKNEALTKNVTEGAANAVEGKVGASIGHSALTVPANLAGAVTAPMEILREVANRDKRYSTLDPNSMGHLAGAYSGAVRGQVAENISGDKYDEQGNKVSDGGAVRQGLAYLYQAGMSAADNIARAAAGGGSKALSLGLAATGSFGQTVQQASAQGASPGEAALLGTVNAALEVGTEYIPLDNLLKQAKGSPHTLLKVLKNVLLQGGIEATTEEISLFGSVLAEAAILREKSAYNRQIAEGVAAGKSYQQAAAEADRAIMQEAVDTLITSWLSGSMSTGAAAAKHAVASQKLGKQLTAQNLDTEDIQSVIDEGLASDKKTDAYKIASELQEKIKSGKKLSAYDLGALYHANVAAIDEEKQREESGESAEAEDEEQTEEREPVRIVENARAVLENAYGVDVTDEQWNEAQQAAKDYGVDIKLYTDEDSDEAGYVKDGEVYINTAVNAPMAETVSRFLGNQAPAAEQQNVPVTQQAAVNNKMNGGMTNGTAASTGAGVLSGGGQRYDGAGTGEQAGSLAGRTGPTAQGRRLTADQYRIQNQRNALGENLRLEKVSSASLGIHSGTEEAGLQVIPEQNWDDSMRAKAEQVYQETGQRVCYVLGRIQIRDRHGNIAYVKGVANERGIVVQANHPASMAEQIADHEAFHGMVRAYGPKLNDQLIAQIREQFTEEEWMAVVDKYVDALRGVIDLEDTPSNAELEKRMEMILEEILADAHAGMNAFGAGATQFTDTVNRFLDENHISRRQDQENGVRQTNGPPVQAEKNTADEGGERYSIQSDVVDVNGITYDKVVKPGLTVYQSVKHSKKDYVSFLEKKIYKRRFSVLAYDGSEITVEFAKENDRVKKDGDKTPRRARGELEATSDRLKMIAVINIKELINISAPIKPHNENSHQWLDAGGWQDRIAYMRDFDTVYPVILHIANAADGRHILYDVSVIKDEGSIVDIDATALATSSDVRTSSIHDKGSKSAVKSIEPSNPKLSQSAPEVKQKFSTNEEGDRPDYQTFEENQTGGKPTEQYSVDELDEEEYARRQEQYSLHTKDSNGYELSSQQQEYFADSKARDGNGRLLVLYHQTDGDFTVFDTRHPGAGARDGGTPFGIFMKRSGRDIGLAGKKQMALYANITNPIRARDREDLNRQLRNISSRYAEIDERHKAIDAEYHDKYEKAGQAWNDYIAEWRKANPNASRRAINDDPKFNELFDAEDAVLEEWEEVSDKLSMQAKEAITEDLRKAGFDGIFLENDAGSWGRKTDAVIALDPEQVKSITNKKPTSDPDIRYSVDELDEEEYARRQERGYQGKAPTQQELEAERQAWLQREYNEKNRKKENKPTIAKQELKKTMLSLFSIPEGVKAETGMIIDAYAERLLKNGALTEEDRTAFFDRMYHAGVMNVPADEYLAQGRSYLLKSRIYVPENVRAEFGDDWEKFRRRAFGNGVYLTKDRHDSGIDVWNHDLASEDMLPGLFNSEDTDLRSILERIVQVAEAGRDESMSLAEYTAQLAGQDYIREDEFLDHMERQMDWALRTFAQMADLEIRLRNRADERVKQEYDKGTERVYKYAYQDAQRRARERQDRKDMARRQRERKELQELQKKTLKQLQWLSKNRNRAPEELKATWDEVLSDIDIYAVSAADEMRWSNKHNATWQDLAQMYKDASKNDPNFLPSPELERIVTRLDGTKIGDMDVGALQDLYKAAVGLRTEFHNRNNVINDEMNRLFAEVYTDAKKEIENAPGSFTGKKGDKFLNMEQLTPMNVLQRMGGWDPDGTFYAMAKQLEKGERDIRAYSVKAKRMLADFLTEHEDWVKKADGQGKDAIWYEVEVPQLVQLGMGDKPIFGPTVKVWMTPTQKVHMYLESKNKDNLRHMTGGRTFADKQLYSEGKRQEALAQGTTIRMAPETVKLLVSDLTEEEMELARLLEQYYNSFATKEINRVSNILYGYDKAMGSHYAPIYTNRNYTKTEFGVFDTTAEGVGNLKGRQYAVNPSYNISALDAFERHVDQTARFVGMAIPARNWTTLMNWREKNNSTGDVITHKWGEEGKKYITDLITRLQAGEDVKTDSLSSGLSKLQSNYISAIFGANPSIVLKQLGSIPMASAYLGVKNAPSLGQIAKIDRDLISKYTQDLEWRTLGYSMPETKILKENPNWTQSNKFYGFVFGGDAITAMDGWAASTLWPWAENKVRREHPELEVGTQAQIDAGESPFYRKVAEEFEDAMARSQSTSDEIHQSQIRKSKNPLTRAFTMFRSDSAQTYNVIRQKIGEAQYYMRSGADEQKVKAAKQAAGAAFMALTVNAMWGEAVNFLMALIKNKGKYYRDEEEELTAGSVALEMVQNMAGSVAGTVTLGEEFFELVGNMLTGEKLYDIETPGMEQLNDVIDVISSAGGGMRDWIAELANVMVKGGNPGQYIKQHGKEVLGHVKEMAETVAMYGFGISASNVESYLLGMVKAISPEVGAAYDDLFQSVSKRDLSGMRGDALAARIGNMLSDRGLDVSDGTAQKLATLYEAGYKSAVPSDIPSSVSIDGETKQMKPYQKQMYGNVWNSIVAGTLESLLGSAGFAEAPAKTKEKMVSYLYTYAAEMAKAELFEGYEPDTRDDDIEAFAKVGLDTTDFLIAYGKYNEIYNMDLSASEKALELAYWAEEEGYTPEQVKTIKTELAYFNMSQAVSTKFDKMLNAGVDPDDAYEAVKEMNALKADADEADVADVEYWRVCIKAASNEWTQASLLAGAMTPDQYKKFKRAFDLDVSPDMYVSYYETRSRFDADGNGSLTNAEVKTAIDALKGGYTNEQKGVLWQLATGSTSAKNNPYSKTAGQKYLDAKAAEKNQ